MTTSKFQNRFFVQLLLTLGLMTLFWASPALAQEPSSHEIEPAAIAPFETKIETKIGSDGVLHLPIQTKQATVQLNTARQVLQVEAAGHYFELPLADLPDNQLQLNFEAGQLRLNDIHQLQALELTYEQGGLTLKAEGKLQLPLVDLAGPLLLEIDGSLNGRSWQAEAMMIKGKGLVNLNGEIQAPAGFISTVAATAPTAIAPHQLDVDPPAFVLTNQAIITSPFILIESEAGWLNLQGQLHARQAQQAGGQITLLGQRIHLLGATLNASGQHGGGQILVGGGYQGLPIDTITPPITYPIEDVNLSHPQTQVVFIDEASLITADALSQGHGGQIIVWSEESSRVHGHLSAKGGLQSGNGGFIETSSRRGLDITTAPNIAAFNGQAGEWLIDPYDTEIVPGSGNTNINASSPFASTGDSAQLGVDLITTGLASGDVTVSTGAGGSQSGIITLTTTLDFDGIGSTGRTLTLNAHDMVVLDGPILDSSGTDDSLNVVINADSDTSGQGRVVISQTIESGGGDVRITGRSSLSSAILITNSAAIRSQGGEISLDGSNTGTSSDILADNRGIFLWDDSVLDADSGAIRLTGSSSGLDGIFAHNNVALTGTLHLTGTSTGSDKAARGIFFRDNASLVGEITVNGNSSGGDGIFFNENATLLNTSGNVISLTGVGNGTGDNSAGIFFNSKAILSGAAITLDGTGGSGDSNNWGIFFNITATLEASNNPINLIGVGNGSGSNNTGIQFSSDATLTGAAITLDGTGGSGSSNNRGIFFDDRATLNAGSNPINLTGVGNGSSSDNAGIHFDSDASLTGAAITLNGTGGSGSDYNRGIFFNDGTTLNAGNNAINLIGVGNGSGFNNPGIHIQSDASLTGKLTLNGVSGTGSDDSEFGIFMGDDVQLNAGSEAIELIGYSRAISGSNNTGIHINSNVSMTGTVSLSGTSGLGNSSPNYGIFMGSNAQLNADSSTIQLTGLSRGTGSSNSGLHIDSSSSLTGTITMNGTGSTGSASSYGLFINSNANFNANNSPINLTGTASDEDGVFIGSNGNFQAGSSTINITGLTSGTDSQRDGIFINNDSTLSASAITLNGDSGTGSKNRGVFINSNTSLDSSGIIDIYGIGTGGPTSSFSNDGIFVANNVMLTGTTFLSGEGDWGRGIFINDNAAIQAFGTAIQFDGRSIVANGLFVGEQVQINSNGGHLFMTGTTSLDQGIVVDQDSTVQSGSGDMTLTANRINIHGDPNSITDTVTNVPTFAGNGILLIQPVSPGLNLTLGGGLTDTAADSNYLSDRELATLSDGFSQIIIGSIDSSGKIKLESTATFSDPILLRSPAGAGNIDTQGFELIGADDASISLLVSQDIAASNITAASGISATSTSGDIVGADISSMVTSGNAGNVDLSAANGNVTVNYIDARATGGGNGGVVQATAGQMVRLIGQIPSTTHTVSTAGAANTSAITITHGGLGLTPFIVGDAAVNGSAGSLTSGDTSLDPTQSFYYTHYESPNIWIISVPEPGLTLSKSATPTSVTAKQGEITYTLSISNDNSTDAINTVLTDTLPISTTFARWVEQPAGATVTNDVITWSGTVTGNSTIDFTFVVSYSGNSGDVISNTADYSQIASNNQATADFIISFNGYYLPLIIRNGSTP